jgi:hypothetical protein
LGLTDVPDDEGDLSRDLYALQTYHTLQDSEGENGRSTREADHGDNGGYSEEDDSEDEETVTWNDGISTLAKESFPQRGKRLEAPAKSLRGRRI